MAINLFCFSAEVLLYICEFRFYANMNAPNSLGVVSFLDLPDLEALAKASPQLAVLTSDPILHRYRLKVVSPSRVQHCLFGTGPHGSALRPTVGDLVQRGVIRGLGIERRWRMGTYFYTLNVRSS